MTEPGWLAKPVARQLYHSDCVVRLCWDQFSRAMSFTRRPDMNRMPSKDQSSRRPLHRKKAQVTHSLAPVSSRSIRRRMA
ncbi:hypothetical protein TNCV_3343541 [Trichonephila clavipes]|nr:hypothetical protein TNCV_3343541 [Trichonephila clavipes]